MPFAILFILVVAAVVWLLSTVLGGNQKPPPAPPRRRPERFDDPLAQRRPARACRKMCTGDRRHRASHGQRDRQRGLRSCWKK